MAIYKVEVIETLSRIVEQKAKSYEDAESKVYDRYRKEDIVLDYEDYKSTEFKPYPSKELEGAIYVNCSGQLKEYNSKEEVMDFYEDCIMMSEGAERERYVDIYFSVKENLNTDRRCFTDGSTFVSNTNFDIEKKDLKELWLLNKYYNLNKEHTGEDICL